LGHGITSMIAIVKYIVAFGKYILVAGIRRGAPSPFYFAWGCFRYFVSGPP
jgi:hypothetical protein